MYEDFFRRFEGAIQELQSSQTKPIPRLFTIVSIKIVVSGGFKNWNLKD